MKPTNQSANKLVSIIAIGFFGFFICHYVSYLIRYYMPEEGLFTQCFGPSILVVYFNLVLSLLGLVIAFFSFKSKISLKKVFLLFLIVGLLMFVLGIGLFGI